MTKPTALLSLATASPPHSLSQRDAEQVARDLFSPGFRHFERMAPVFTSAGIRSRQLVQPIEWYLQPRGWPERAEYPLLLREAQSLLEQPPGDG